MVLYPITALINALTSIIVCFVAIIRNPKSPLNRSLCYFAISVAFWSANYFLWQTSSNSLQALFYCRILMAGALFIPPTFLHFSLALIGKIKTHEKTIIMWYVASILFLLTDLSPLFVSRVEPALGFKYWPKPGITFTPFLIMFFGLVVYAHYLMFKSYKRLSGIRRNQIKYVFLGTAIGFIGGSTNYPLWYGIPLLPIGNGLVAVYVFLLAYSVIKYKLMDINIAITRVAIFSVVYIAVLGFPLGMSIFLKNWLNLKLGENWYLFPIFFAIILASAGPFIFMFLRKQAENLILKEQRIYQRFLSNLSKEVVNIRDMNELLRIATTSIADAVKVNFCAIYINSNEYKYYQLKKYVSQDSNLRPPENIPYNHRMILYLNHDKAPFLVDEMESEEIDLPAVLYVPCFGKEGLNAVIMLGAKRNNQIYTTDDLLVFENLSYTISLAFENCFFWKEIEERQRKARIHEMDTFAYSLAHEIDNPMTVVLNLSKFLKGHFLKYITDDKERTEVEQTCEFLVESAKRVSGMVQAIRAFGQKTSAELIPLKLQDVIEGFCKLYLPELKANSVYFIKEMPKVPIYIKGIAAEIQQVLMILAKNSIHAMKFSSIKKITLTVVMINYNYVQISLKDTGYGIKKENVEAIFAPFVTTKASTEGTGMGLYNAKGFIQRHKGRIWAESEGPEKGASFCFELPIAQDVTTEEIAKTAEKKWKF